MQRDRAERNLTAATGTANTLVFELAQEFRDRGLPVDLVRKLLNRARDLQRQLTSSGEMSPALLNSEAAALCEIHDLQRPRRVRGGARGSRYLPSSDAKSFRKIRPIRSGNASSQQLTRASPMRCGSGATRRGAGSAYREGLAMREALPRPIPAMPPGNRTYAISHERIGDAGRGRAARKRRWIHFNGRWS